MTTDALRAWLAGLAESEALVPARVVLDRLPADDARTEALPPAPSAAVRLLDVAEGAQRLNVSERWIYRRSKTLPFVRRVGRGIRIDEAALNKWLARRAP